MIGGTPQGGVGWGGRVTVYFLRK